MPPALASRAQAGGGGPAPAGRLRRFFLTPGPALDLAVFRVTIFATLLAYAVVERREILTFAALPRELVSAPIGWDRVLGGLPLGSAAVTTAWWVLVAAAALGLLGLWARPAAAVCAVLAVYVLGVPQFFGKVDHLSQHLVWFLALLAASPCADALSLDALRCRRAGRVADAGPSVAYSLPLRLVWILIGLAYLFPGLAKLARGGIDMQGYLHQRWAELGWLPFLRIDRYPALLEAASIATVAFECTFLVLVFFDRLRLLAAAAGLVFHNLTGVFMQISFWTLQAAYVSFVPWSRLVERLRAGWGAAPTARAPAPAGAPSGPGPRGRLAPLLGVAAVLIAAQVGFGVANVTEGWPFAAYPKFDKSPSSTRRTLVVSAVDARGRSTPVDLSPLEESMSAERLTRLLALTRHGRPQRQLALLRVIERSADLPPGTVSLRLDQAKVSTDPDESREPRDLTPLRSAPVARTAL